MSDEKPDDGFDPEEKALVASLVGRTIIAAEWAYDVSSGWWGHDESIDEQATLTLDDGRRILFAGYGHDAWGLTIGAEIDPPADPQETA